MNEKQFIPYAKQSISQEDIEAINQVLINQIITRGPKVQEFEQAIAQYCDAEYALAFSSGTAALMAACFAADIGHYDSVYTSPNTFVSTIGSAWQRGANPIFIDINTSNGGIDVELLEGALNDKNKMTRGKHIIIPIHFSGIPIDMQLLDSKIKNPQTIVIEDAAHALGSKYKTGQKVGSCTWSLMTIFSFHPSKNITTGEGGLVTTHNKEIYHKLKLFRDNGIEREEEYFTANNNKETFPGYYEVHSLTGNYHMTAFQAALGLSQLKRLDQFLEKRRHIMRWYREALKGESIAFLSDFIEDSTAFHICVIKIDFKNYKKTRDYTMQRLKKEGIGTQVHYIPLYEHPYFKKRMGEIGGYFPEMSQYYEQALTLPLYYDLQEGDVKRICNSLMRILKS